VTAEEFYALRDDRTNQCARGNDYTDACIGITIDDQAADTYAGQVAFLLLVNLTARWCRRIRLIAPRATVDRRLGFLRAGFEDLSDLALAIARSADPFGDFDSGPATSSGWLRVHVGSGSAPDDAHRIRGSGWIALAGDTVSTPEAGGDEAIGAALAACIGAAWAFRNALRDSPPLGAVRLSLWNMAGGEAAVQGPVGLETRLGLAALIGCGAVGSSMAYLLPLVNAKARLVLVDKDPVDITNLNRSPLFFYEDFKAPKTRTLATYLRRAGFDVDDVPMWFDEALLAKRIFAERPDIVIPAANEHGVRLAVQQQVPPIQVYGTTGRDWQAFMGRHIPQREDCLTCRFPVQAPAVPLLRCATSAVSMPDQPVSADAALPFLSMAAAVLATAELIKTSHPGFPQNGNFVCLDFRGPLTDFFVVQKAASPTCSVCQFQTRVWTKLNERTLFSSLSVAR